MEAEANSREAEAVVPILDELAAARLRKLVLLQGNDECADCRAPEPTWASVAQGVFVCTQCAGVHRSLGDAAVVSIKLDKWTEEPRLAPARAEDPGVGEAADRAAVRADQPLTGCGADVYNMWGEMWEPTVQ